MSVSRARRRLASIAIVGALGLVGGIATASPAAAAEDTLVVLTPVDESVLDTRAVEVSGTGTPTATIQVTSVRPPFNPSPTIVETDGTWTLTVEYADTTPPDNSILVEQTLAGEAAGSVVLGFTIPAPNLLFVDNVTTGTRTPVVSGRAPAGTEVTATIDGEFVGSALADDTDLFDLALIFSPSAGFTADVLLEGPTGNAAVQPVTITIDVPAALPAPVVSTPTTGATIVGDRVTFSGIATPGTFVNVLAFNRVAPGDVPTAEGGPSQVDSAGRWSVTVAIAPGSYFANVYLTAIADPEYVLESFYSTLDFDVVPAVLSPAGAQLAATGPTSIWLAAPGTVLLLLGIAMVLARRRRSSVPF